ncbi:MAG: dTMP kinase [Clostridia bacterium]|nr:MAG: dTMP kinase [Clostridia bacterium]
MAGFFLTLEGPEGAGKTTHTRLLARVLQQEGYQVVATREPGGTRLGEAVRTLLLAQDTGAISPMAETLLYLAARAEHVARVIRPALETGAVVICDRFLHSTLAYQGYGRGLPLGVLLELNRAATAGLEPDHTFVLDVDVAEGLQRVGRTRDRLEAEDISFHQRVRQGFLELAAREQRVTVVPTGGGIEATAGLLAGKVKEVLRAHAGRK